MSLESVGRFLKTPEGKRVLNMVLEAATECVAEMLLPSVARQGRQSVADAGNPGRACGICLDKQPMAILLPCRHMFCAECAARIDVCALCRAEVEDRIAGRET